jgi:hypothetical protein
MRGTIRRNPFGHFEHRPSRQTLQPAGNHVDEAVDDAKRAEVAA